MAPRWRVAAIAWFLIAAGACTPDAGDAGGEEIERLYNVFSVIAAIIFVITAGLILWSILRYRGGPDEGLPKQTDSNVRLEVVWFAIPQIIVVALFVLSVTTLGTFSRQTPSGEEGEPDPLVVRTQGFQWGWRFTYEDAGVQVTGTARDDPEIVLPVDVPITFDLISNDVIHSFYVPRFLVKRDVVPGLENRVEITITEPGTYNGKCAEFCGLLHGEMNFLIRAVEDDEFEAWLDERQDERQLESESGVPTGG